MTMKTCSIVDAQFQHLLSVTPELREIDPDEVDASSGSTLHVLADMWRTATTRRTVLIGDAPAAVCGCSGASETGHPWLFVNRAFEPLPDSVSRRLRSEIRSFLRVWPVLEIDVVPDSERAFRFFHAAGFSIVQELTHGGKSFLRMRIERSEWALAQFH